MRAARPFLGLLMCMALLAGCGSDDDDGGADAGGPEGVYLANVNAQCLDVRERRAALPVPEAGNTAQLARYLAQSARLGNELVDNLGRIDPPPSQAAVHRRAQRSVRRLTEVVASYERAARGGRPFDQTMSGLEPEINSVLRRTNPMFERDGLNECVEEELDFGYSDDN